MHIGLIAVAMALGHHVAVDFVRQRALDDVRTLGAQAHGAAQIGIFIPGFDTAVFVFPFGDQGDDRIRAVGVKFSAVGVFQPGHMAGEFDGGDLHPEADAQIRHLVFTRKTGGTNFAFDAANTKATRYQDGVKLGQLCHVVRGDGFRVDVVDLDAHMVFHAGVANRFIERFVAVTEFHILADHDDVDVALRVCGFIHQVIPAFQVRRRRVQAQFVADQPVQALFVQHAGHFVDGVHVPHRDHSPVRHVGEKRYFFPLFIRDGAVGTADERIGLNADFAQLLGGVLGRLGFEFTGGCNPGHIAQVHKGAVVGPHLQAHLAHGLQERQRLDVAHGTADFNDGNIHRVRGSPAGAPFDEILDFIGDVRNHLHRFAQVVATALFLQHAFVDLAGGEIVGLLHAGFHKALVVAQIKIGFCAVIGDENLAMLKRRHRARIHVKVGIELDQSDLEASRLQERG